MMTVKLETVLSDSFEQEHQVKQTCKQRVSKQKKGRMCTEWRKVRSRMAARSRREKESQLFREIIALLPVAPHMEAQLDKASVIRLTIAYLHLRALLDSPGPGTVTAMTQALSSSQGMLAESSEKWILDCALGGFLLIVSLNGKIIFTTKDVISHTGINQRDLIGRSLFDFMHPCDQNEIKTILMRLIGSQGEQKCEVFIRIKATGNHRLTPWKVIHCTGVKKSSSIPGFNCLILLCRSLPVQEIIEMEAGHLNSRMFLSIHGPDMKFTYCHSGVLELTGFSDTELYGQSVYQYFHPSDCQHVLKAHLSLFSKGQVYTGKYRLLQKGGGYVWAETDATVVYNIQTGKPESVVCINYILSAVELPDVVFSLEQTDCLLKSCDSIKPVAHSIPAPLNRVLKNETYQATCTTDNHPRVVSPHCEKEGATNGRIEIMLKTAICESLTCDICELDLDSLAPYIPMDEEDFLLTPPLDGVVHSDLDRHLPPLSTSWLKLDPELHSPLDKVFPPTTGISSTLLHTDNYFPLTNRVNKSSEYIPSRQLHDFQHKVNRKQQVQACGISSIQNRTNQQWTEIRKVSEHLTKNLWKNSDERITCYQNPPVLWGTKYSRLSWCPPGPLSQHTTKTTEDKMCSASVGLPVLTRWECEANAPLGPTSYLLQGTELTTVLDQVASRVSWY